MAWFEYHLNVVELNKFNTIYLLLVGLHEHQNEPSIIINTCNAISSMVDAEEECAYGMTQKITDDVTAIPFLGSLMRMHIEKYEVVKHLQDDIVSEMKCSEVYEDVNDIKYAYLDFWDLKQMCDVILDRINNLKPLTHIRLKLNNGEKNLIKVKRRNENVFKGQ
ncbi:hypothetical protein HELRODRAFT_165680 [Helobdella robusta]|uniref:Uncharacterized protein n=1 Tax=Helobdella robusta TaxID=6412 RepID=T1EX58_HELRO|nr:hypothetical protein HELRODRAFT_165680 [Helobdella robusta]ESN91626.1 hypothetical protein HELRODRAFT_165680 [Helobdella robusta]